MSAANSEVSRFMHGVGKLLFRLLGWNTEGAVHQPQRFVLIAAPHTSNWDAVVIMVLARAVATVWGASGAAGSFAAAFSQPVIGWTIDHFSYEPVFAAVSLLHIFSAAVVSIFIRRVEPITSSRHR